VETTMPNDELERLRSDLTTIRSVMRLEKPCDTGDIPVLLLVGLGALGAIPLLMFTMWQQRLTLILMLLPGLIMYGYRYLSVKRTKDERPGLWREHRLGLIAGAFAVPLSLGWIWWSQIQFGTTREAPGAAVLFCIGAFLIGIGAFNSTRRSALLSGVGLAMFALAIPWMTPRQIAPIGATVLAMISLLTAALNWWSHCSPAACRNDRESLT
jgi:hypothetical protein